MFSKQDKQWQCFAFTALIAALFFLPVASSAESKVIPGQYIVVFKSSVENPKAEALNLVKIHGGNLKHTYSHSIKGFAAQLPEAALEGILHNPNVDYIEQDSTVSHQAVQNIDPTVPNAFWGIDRIDQRLLPLDLKYNYNYTGAGVYAFIIDTGIRSDHVEFSGRMLPGMGFIADGYGTEDCKGHGTHVAGSLGGTNYGVAKGVKLIPVRVLDCNGSAAWSTVIAGIDWVAASTLRPAVANLSLGGLASTSVDAAIAAVISKGIAVVVAAGNNSADACNYSPARTPTAITVAATTSLDARTSYTNFGPCVDLFAPGHLITSAGITSSTATNTMGGTSMASPHVAGVAALALQANPTLTPAQVASLILSSATRDVLRYVPIDTPNLLLNSLLVAGPAPTPSPTPSPSPTPTVQTIAVKSIAGSSAKSSYGWRAYATVTVRDANTGAVVANVTVNGNFSLGGSASCVTDSSGSCRLTSAIIKRNLGTSTNLSIQSLSGSQMVYDSSKNLQNQILITSP